MAYSKTTYTGPVKNRGEDDQGRALVSREELADFRRKYGADKTLRDLLNADRSGKLPEVSSERDMRARGVQGANTAPSGRAEIPTSGAAKAPASTGEGGMSDTTRNVLNTLGALGAGAGAGMGARALMRREAAKRAAEAERLASRVDPRMRRSGEGIDEAMKQARVEMAREPRLEPARAMSAAEKKAPAVQGDKARATPRSRTRDEEDVEFRKGGKVKAYAKGGSVRGAGIAQRGVKPCKVC